MFYVFSFPAGVYAGTLNLIASIPGPYILTCSIAARIMSLSLGNLSCEILPDTFKS